MHHHLYSKYELDINDYKKIRRINKGGFSIIYNVKNKETGKFYAAKVIDCGDDEDECINVIEREVGILMFVNHPTIIKFVGFSITDFNDEKNITIIMDIAANGSIADIIKKIQLNDKPLEYTNTARQLILIGISRGMKYLHDRNIIHRDLKSGNVLLDENFHPKISDFGLSKLFEYGHSNSQSKIAGTLPYIAPEMFKSEIYDRKVDVYSFGILMFEVISDSFVYPDLMQGKMTDYEFKSKVMNENYRPIFNFPINDNLKNLIEQCWSNDPNERPTFGDIFIKLSSCKDYFLDDVDIQIINNYIDDITQINDNTEHLLYIISTLQKENDRITKENIQLKMEIQQLKSNTTNTNTNTKENIQLKMEIQQLKSNTINTNQTIQDVLPNHDKLTISECNKLPLNSQYSILKNIKSEFVIKINHLIAYFLNFDELAQLNQVIQFVSNEKEYLTKINDECQIKMSQILIDFLFHNNLLQSDDFINVIQSFDNLCFTIKYPSDSFQEKYNLIMKLKNIKKSFMIEINITGIEETDQKFNGDKNIDFVRIDEPVNIIKSEQDKGSFSKCKLIKRITILSSVISIEDYAFSECSSLTEISLPSSVAFLGKGAFYHCYSLKKIIIPSLITSIGKGTFIGCHSLTQVCLPSSLTIIGDDAFYGCKSLKLISIPSSVTYIGQAAFDGCLSLRQISIPSSVTLIAEYTFRSCTSLEQISLPSSITAIGCSAFESCESLSQISIPSSVTSIGRYAFRYCKLIKQLSIPSCVTCIADYAFEGCTSITQMSIPSSITSIGCYVFNGCSALTEVSIPSSITSIGDGAFYNCSSLTQVYIPHSVSRIGNCIFKNCTSLKQVYIPSKFKRYEIGLPSSVTISNT